MAPFLTLRRTSHPAHPMLHQMFHHMHQFRKQSHPWHHLIQYHTRLLSRHQSSPSLSLNLLQAAGSAMQRPYSGSPVLYNFRTGVSSVLSGGRKPCSRISSRPLLCDHNLREESLQPGRLQHLKEVLAELLLLLLSTCTPPILSLAQLRKLAILAQCPQQPMLPVIAILARSNRPLCLQLSPSSRACQHL